MTQDKAARQAGRRFVWVTGSVRAETEGHQTNTIHDTQFDFVETHLLPRLDYQSATTPVVYLSVCSIKSNKTQHFLVPPLSVEYY